MKAKKKTRYYEGFVSDELISAQKKFDKAAWEFAQQFVKMFPPPTDEKDMEKDPK